MTAAGPLLNGTITLCLYGADIRQLHTETLFINQDPSREEVFKWRTGTYRDGGGQTEKKCVLNQTLPAPGFTLTTIYYYGM